MGVSAKNSFEGYSCQGMHALHSHLHFSQVNSSNCTVTIEIDFLKTWVCNYYSFCQGPKTVRAPNILKEEEAALAASTIICIHLHLIDCHGIDICETCRVIKLELEERLCLLVCIIWKRVDILHWQIIDLNRLNSRENGSLRTCIALNVVHFHIFKDHLGSCCRWNACSRPE